MSPETGGGDGTVGLAVRVSAARIARRIAADRRAAGQVLVSIPRDGNGGCQITREERAFALWLIDRGGVDRVHGPWSHPSKGREADRSERILQGWRARLNAWPGIERSGRFGPDVALMCLP
jgi:hypothetical protein